MSVATSRLGAVAGALLGLAALGVACGRATVQPDATTDSNGAARPPVVFPRGIVKAPYVAVHRTVGSCSEPQGNIYAPASVSEAVSLLVGHWQRCSGGFASGGPIDGLELDPDRRWLVLAQTASGLAPETGPDTEAVWFLGAEDPRNSGSIDDLELLFVPPTTMTGQVMYSVTYFQNPTGFDLAGAMTFNWLGD
jgi:hypothetical protein